VIGEELAAQERLPLTKSKSHQLARVGAQRDHIGSGKNLVLHPPPCPQLSGKKQPRGSAPGFAHEEQKCISSQGVFLKYRKVVGAGKRKKGRRVLLANTGREGKGDRDYTGRSRRPDGN